MKTKRPISKSPTKTQGTAIAASSSAFCTEEELGGKKAGLVAVQHKNRARQISTWKSYYPPFAVCAAQINSCNTSVQVIHEYQRQLGLGLLLLSNISIKHKPRSPGCSHNPWTTWVIEWVEAGVPGKESTGVMWMMWINCGWALGSIYGLVGQWLGIRE